MSAPCRSATDVTMPAANQADTATQFHRADNPDVDWQVDVRTPSIAVVENVVGGRQHNIDLTESQFLKLARRVEHTAELDLQSLVSVHASMTGNGINKRVTEGAQADTDHRTFRRQLITFWGSIPTADNTARAAFLPGQPETDPPG